MIIMNQSFEYKKSLGQNFLVDKNVIHKIVDSACIDKDTFVIEIGPGSGAITKEIVPLSYYTLLYEADSRLKEKLEALLGQYTNYSLKIGDFLKVDIHEDLSKYQYNKLYVVANLPYYITSPIISKFLNDTTKIDRMYFMVQKEVAERLAAKVSTKDYNAFSILTQYEADIKVVLNVKRTCFHPQPNVDSAVVEIKRREKDNKPKDEKFFKSLVLTAFKERRKTLINNLSSMKSKDELKVILSELDIPVDVRSENLTIDDFIRLSDRMA